MLREEHRGLAGRVPAADDRHLRAGAHAGLEGPCRVVDPQAEQLVDPRHVQVAVPGTRGDHHAPRLHGRAVAEPDGVAAVARLERRRLRRDHQACAELAGLHAGALGELHARDPGWEAEVVLDPRRGPRLAAGGHRVDRHRLESLGGAVDGGRESGGPRSHHQQVARRFQTRAQDRGDTQTVGQLCVRGVSQQVLAQEDDRRLLRAHAEFAQQGVGPRLLLEVHEVVRVAIPRHEHAQPPRVGRVARPDHPGTGPDADQPRAPCEERPEHRLRQDGVGVQDIAKPVRGRLDHLPVVDHASRQVHPLARDQVHLAQESPLTVDGDDPLARLAGVAQDRDPAAEQHEEVVVIIALPEEDLALADVPAGPDRLDQRDGVIAQLRERALGVERFGELAERDVGHPDRLRGEAQSVAAAWRGFVTGTRACSISSRRSSRNGGRMSFSPRCSGSSSTPKPGPRVATSNRTPLGSRK